MTKKIFIIAGEDSGDILASGMMRELNKLHLSPAERSKRTSPADEVRFGCGLDIQSEKFTTQPTPASTSSLKGFVSRPLRKGEVR